MMSTVTLASSEGLKRMSVASGSGVQRVEEVCVFTPLVCVLS